MAAADQIVWDDEQKPDAGIVWDAPTPQKPRGNALTGSIDMLMAAADRNLLTPIEKGIAGTGARVFGQDPEKAKQWVENNLTYHPQTQMGDVGYNRAADQIAPVLAPIGQTVNAIDKGVGAVAGPKVQNVVRQFAGAGSDLLNVVPAAGVASRAASEGLTAARAAAQASAGVARTPIEQAEAAGLRIAPSTVRDTTGAGARPGLSATLAEAAAGHGKVTNDMILHNRPVINGIATQDLGLPSGTPISDTALQQAAKPHAQVYEAVKTTIPDAIAPDPSLTKAVMEAGRGTDSTLPLPPELKKYQDAALVPMNGSQMLATISDLRTQGWKGYLAKDNPQLNAVGNAQLELASALENRLGQIVQDRAPELAGAYQQARKGFAKIEAVKAARVGNDIDAQVLRRMNNKTGALDGGLKVIADAAEMFPKETRVRLPEPSDVANAINATLRWGTLGAVPLLQKALSKVVGATRGESAIPELGPNGRLGYNYRGNESPLPATNPPLTLTPPPGQAFEPHQPSLLRSGEQLPLAESTQHLRPDGRLAPPPGRAFDPAQYDLLTMLAEKLRERE